MDFKDKTVIVTGASSGIGEATVKAFIKRQANVLMVARSEDKLKELSDGVYSRYLALDLTDEKAAEKIVGEATIEWERIDIVVNAAGILQTGSIMNTSLEDFDYMMNINMRSVFSIMQTAIPFLKETKGNIVNVSSVVGLRAFPNILSYCVSKAALDHLTRCSALELAPFGIRVNAVNPGVITTNLHKASGMDEKSYENFLEHSKTTHPLGRVGEPEEVAELILFLASDKAGWITGETVSIDGGRFLTCLR
ncbi:MAG: glucose 1-dehydrogenase [Asgard group archaeon]|nr:glucose 1-dehydrogenase [Asgard group archaeon]